jgi:galactose mutarotase-like enzyme
LREARWEIEILPERGGRVRSLRLDGVELLDQGIGVDNPQAEDFVEGGAFGWDEMVPTVDRTDTLPDHGEAWRLPWTTVVQSRSSCSMECEGRVLPWRLRRQIIIAPDGVQVNYDLTNIGSKPIPGFWCAHPLFKYEAGMEVDIGSTLMAFAEGKSAKFFLPRGAIDHARLKWEAGPAIEISWDAQAAPYCGVWICNGDIGGYRQVAIEPSTGGGDRPDSDEPPPTLQPGESLAWWLKIRPL